MGTRRRFANVALVALLVAVLAPTQLAVSQTAPSVELVPASGAASSGFVARGSGFSPRLDLQIWWGPAGNGELLFEVAPLGQDTFSVEVVVPANAPPGTHRVVACQPDRGAPGTCALQAFANFEVVAPPTTSSTTSPTTTLPIGSSTTTVPPTTSPTTTLPLGSSTTTVTTTTTLPLGSSTTAPPNPGDIGTPPTTVGGFPPPPSTIGPGTFGVSTTTPQPPLATPTGISNLAITDLEVTQGLQDLQNRFPLVTNRRTIVRVHGISETANPDGQTGVRAAIQGIRLDGGSEELGIVFSENTAQFTGSTRREVHDRSPYVILPESWATGTVKLRAWIWVDDPTAGNEPTASDNLAEVTVEFHQTPAVHLWYWPLYLTEDFDPSGDPVIWFPADGWLSEHLGVFRIWPVSALVAHRMNAVVGDASTDFDLSEDGNSAAPNLLLDELWLASQPGDFHLYSGMVHPSFDGVARFDGFASGIGVSTWSIMGFGFSGPWSERSAWVIAHEGGHAFGLSHAPCEYIVGDPIPGEVSGGAVDPTFPGSYGWPACTLAPSDAEGFYGLDVYWEWSPASKPTILSNALSAEYPNAAFPWMGYRAPGWIDPWHGCFMLGALGVPCTQTDLVFIDTDSPTGGGIPTPAPHPQSQFDCSDFSFDGVDMCQFAPTEPFDPTANQEDVIVSGFVNPQSGDAEVVRVLTLPDHVDPQARVWGDPHVRLDEETTWVLAALDEFGVARWIEPIPVESSGHIGDTEGNHAFVLRFPRIDGVVEYLVMTPGGRAAELRASATPPTVTAAASLVDADILGIEAEVADPDAGPAWTVVRYRPDPDSNWKPVSAATTSASIQVDVGHLPGSAAGQLQLLTTDGFHTVQTDLTVVLPQQAPRVLILSPIDGAQRPAGRPIDLRVQADDPEDGLLPDVAWTSDIDGDLGTGSLLTVWDLTEGSHAITATAVDSSGTEGSSTIQLTILPSDLPDPATVDAIAAVFRDGPQDPVAADESTEPRSSVPWILLLGGAIAVGAAVVIGRLWSGRREN